MQIVNDPKFKDMESKERQSLALFAMAIFGVGDAIGGPLQGFIIDRFGTKNSNYASMSVIALTLLLTIKNLKDLEYGVYSYLMCFFWGLQDAFVNITIYRCLGF